MTARWQDVRCARIPVADLSLLADLRGRSEIRVSIIDGMAWICWETDSRPMRAILARRILPLPSVELYTERDGRWYRLGQRLPAFDVPISDGSAGVSLDRIILPTPIQAQAPERGPLVPLGLSLVRDERSQVRPASALRCPLRVLAAWAERATSAQIACLQGVWCGGSPGTEDDALMLALGTPPGLPLLPDSVRFWGTDLLIPLGFRTDPDLPEPALHRAVGAGAGELAVLDRDGLELIARRVFQPLSRGGIRLASQGRTELDTTRGARND
jgi:hypothetical protein